MDFPKATVQRGGIDFNEVAGTRPDRHDCRLPNLRQWWTEAEASDDWRAEWWKCPECGQTWTIDWDTCYECMRRYDEPEAHRTGDMMIGPWSEHGHFWWKPPEREKPKTRPVTHDIITAGGWCSPSEAIYGLSLDLQDEGPW